MKYPAALENLIASFENLPGVGKKTAERYALFVLNQMQDTEIVDFANSLVSLKQDIHTCSSCGNISESHLCPICSDESRNHRVVLVVETIKDLYAIERVGEYDGIYHVLNGAISYSKGITIDDLNIDTLISKAKNKELDEIILATNATLEGETTARYLKELLKEYNVKITRIASGLPVGGDISYADEMTVIKAYIGRREY